MNKTVDHTRIIRKLTEKVLDGLLSVHVIPAYADIPDEVTEDVLQFTRGDTHPSVIVEVPADLIEDFIEAPDIQRRELTDLLFKRYGL